MTMYYVYIVECSDGSLYTGWTNNIGERMKKHNSGKGSRYTRSRYPVDLKCVIEFSSQKEAMQSEYAMKQLTREQKLSLINSQAN